MKYIYNGDRPKAYSFGYVTPDSVWELESLPDEHWDKFTVKEIKKTKDKQPKEEVIDGDN